MDAWLVHSKVWNDVVGEEFMNAYEALADFSGRFLECTVTLRFQPHPNNQTYYVLEILFPQHDLSWGIIKAGSFSIDQAAKDLFDAWNEMQTKNESTVD